MCCSNEIFGENEREKFESIRGQNSKHFNWLGLLEFSWKMNWPRMQKLNKNETENFGKEMPN